MGALRITVGLVILTLSACTWVKMEPEGNQIRVAGEREDLSVCTKLGEIGVEVKDKVGFYRRDPIKVRDELEVMARNEAPRLGADTLQPIDEPLNGERRYQAFRCGAARPVERAEPTPRAEPLREEGAETYPLREG